MSETARKLFDSLRAVREGVEAMAPGLKTVIHETGAEMKRLGVQGQMELASALFNGNAFVPYGPGQYTPSPEHPHDHAPEHERARGMER